MSSFLFPTECRLVIGRNNRRTTNPSVSLLLSPVPAFPRKPRSSGPRSRDPVSVSKKAGTTTATTAKTTSFVSPLHPWARRRPRGPSNSGRALRRWRPTSRASFPRPAPVLAATKRICSLWLRRPPDAQALTSAASSKARWTAKSTFVTTAASISTRTKHTDATLKPVAVSRRWHGGGCWASNCKPR